MLDLYGKASNHFYLLPADVKILSKKSLLARREAAHAVAMTHVRPRWVKHVGKFRTGQSIKCKIGDVEIKAAEKEYGKKDEMVMISLAPGLVGPGIDPKQNRFCLHFGEDGKYKLGGIRFAAIFEYSRGMALGQALGYPFTTQSFKNAKQMIAASKLRLTPPTTCEGCIKPKTDNMKACSRCYAVRYCSTECFHAHWPTHKPDCTPLQKPQKKPVEQKVAEVASTAALEEED